MNPLILSLIEPDLSAKNTLSEDMLTTEIVDGYDNYDVTESQCYSALSQCFRCDSDTY